ncbi:Two component regulator propeller [bacterium A37T11]|nr:Two component regulator propeller [bacterium A37T11]
MKKLLTTTWIIFGCFLLLTRVSFGQDVRFARVGVKDGLSQGTIFSIYQDYKGLMWIGTRDGLNCYDSKKFTVYRNIPADSVSLFDNNIHALKEDSKRRLWVGTTAGLNLFHRQSATFSRFYVGKLLSGNGEREPSFNTIAEDSKGRVWFGSNKGLFLLQEGKVPRLELVFDPSFFPSEAVGKATRNIYHIDVDDTGKLWLSTEGGVVCLMPHEANKVSVWAIYNKGNGKLNDDHTRFAASVKPGVIWVGTKEGGINEINVSTGKVRYILAEAGIAGSLASNDVRSLLKDRKGGFWIGTFGGLNYFNWKKGFITYVSVDNDPFSLSNNSIRPLYQDRRGSVWVGTFYGGVSIADRYIPKFTNYAKSPELGGLSSNVISCLLEAPGRNLWIGTEGGGVNMYHRNSEEIINFRHKAGDEGSLSHDNVKAMCLDSLGNLWVGTYQGGLNLLQKGSTYFKHFKHDNHDSHSLPNDNVYALAADKRGNIWAGTYGGGLSCLNKGSQSEFETYSWGKEGKYHLSSNQVRTIFCDSQGNLWVGTENGLNVKWKNSASFEIFQSRPNDPYSLSSNLVFSVFEDHHHKIWIGTVKGGLHRFDPLNKHFIRYDEKDGLDCNNILAIGGDRKDRLWLSTTNGIYRYSPNQGHAKLYNTKDGLLSNEFTIGAVCQLQEGELAFGGTNGFTIFQPNRFNSSGYRPPCIFTAFRLFNKEVLPGVQSPLKLSIGMTKKLVLNHNQRTFTLDFAVLNYILPEKNQYAYKLEGLDKDWNIVNTPSATYTSLAPGHYTLLAKGANNDGIWNDKVARLEIEILPAPWQTWWAYVLYAIGTIFLAVLVIKHIRDRSLLKHQLQLEYLAMQRQREIGEIKLGFFTQISHELRTPLTLILSPLQRLMAQKSNVNEEEWQMLGTMKQNADRLLQMVNQLLDFRKQEIGHIVLQKKQHDMTAFVQQIAQSFTFLAAEREVEFVCNLPEMHIQLDFDTDQMHKVIMNLLANAFKFTPSGGKVCLTMKEELPTLNYIHGFVRILVWDNGKGIPADKLTEIFEWYVQVHPSGGPDGQTGTGIGLALSKKLVELHGGNVYAESNLGKGSPVYACFTVDIPKGEVMDETSDISIIATKANRKPVIVLAEDHQGVRHEIVQCIGSHYRILEACDGIEAWELIRQELPDLVITDLMMPGCDGMGLLKRIKQDVSTNHIPVLILTARSAETYLLAGLEAGCDDYLHKPFHPQVLSLKVFNMLEARERFRQKFTRQMISSTAKEEGQSPAVKFLKEFVDVVERFMESTDFKVQLLSSQLGVSRPVLYRKVKQLTGLNIVELINLIRLRKAAYLIIHEGLHSNEVAYRVGFNDPKYFAKSFKAFYGMTPKEYFMTTNHKQVEEAGLFIDQLLVSIQNKDDRKKQEL